MNIPYLTQHISRHLHTIVRSVCLSTGAVFASFCARKDFSDPCLTPEILAACLKQTGDLPLLFSLNQQAVYAIVPLAEAGCPRQFCSVKEKPSNLGCQADEARCSCGKSALVIGPVRFPSSLCLHVQEAVPPFPPDFLDAVPVCGFSDFSMDILLACNLFRSSPVAPDDLTAANCLNSHIREELAKDYSSALFDSRESRRVHNPYDQEIREFTSIEQGDLQSLRQSLAEDYPGQIGILAKDEIRHQKNLGIVVVTLASRAAIRGGLLPEISFSMSDLFIQKLEEISDPVVLDHMMRQFEFQYAQAVADLRARRPEKQAEPPHITRCKDYIFLASEGITISRFILNEKISLTKNLLTYSSYTYSEIAAYLGFSSQSHLGKSFKTETGMTLRQYRLKFGMREFRDDPSLKEKRT